MSDNTSIDKVVTVTLHIHDGDPPGAGWIPVDSSIETPYSYKFTGGNRPRQNGNIVHKIDNVKKAVEISLHQPKKKKRYEFVLTAVIFDDRNQLTRDPVGPETATFHNACTDKMDAQYCVRVRDLEVRDKEGEFVTVCCDPAIRNKPV